MRIFKTIRKKLLFSGKLKGYFVYALGEILLITIGILIAWKINNLNEIRKDKVVEIKIYENLYGELHTNLNLLDNAIVRYTTNQIKLQKTLLYIGRPVNNLSQETKDFIVEVSFGETHLRSETLNSINNTNKFEFLGNKSLRELIVMYPSEISEFETEELKIKNIIETRLKPVIEEHISLIDMLPKENEIYSQLRTIDQQSSYGDLLNSRNFQNSIVDRLLHTQIQIKNANSLRAKTETLAIKLKHELKG